jgi:sugar lactone lactonase YvrE
MQYFGLAASCNPARIGAKVIALYSQATYTRAAVQLSVCCVEVKMIVFPMQGTRLRSLLVSGVAAATFLVAASQAKSQVTSAPVFNASTVGNVTTLSISDATPGASIYYATAGRTPTTQSIQYTGPLTILLPFSIEAIAVAPGYSQSAVASTSYTTVLGTTAVTTSANPATVNNAVTFTATVTPSGSSVPSGSLQFYVNNIALGPPMQLNSSDMATYTTSELPEAYLSITAAYSPASGAPTTISTSPALIQGVYESARQSAYVYFNNAIKPLGSGFNHPYGIAVDANENVFVADSGNQVVKELTAASGYGTINTLGTTFADPTSVAVDANENVFVADAAASAVYELPAATGYASKTPIASGFNYPYGVAMGSNGDLFVADTGNHAVKWLTAASGYTNPTPVGGTFQYPWGVAVDSANNLFVTDIGNHTVNLSYAGSSPSTSYTSSAPLGTAGFFSNPYGVAVDADDDLFVTDVGYGAVREISLIDGWTSISTPSSGLAIPIGAAVDASGNIFVTDTNNNSVKEITQTGGNFGSINVGNTSSYAISMSFFFNAPTSLGSYAILTGTGGTPSPDFSDAGTGTCYPNTPYAGISTCTVNVLFNPQQSGMRSATVELLDYSGVLLASGIIQGVGVSH